ncbi:MAG: hypothetical protein HZA54_07830 [Planctomycetes bacterium]|nr:hypothetical protein [Planctomycetota bacterium]
MSAERLRWGTRLVLAAVAPAAIAGLAARRGLLEPGVEGGLILGVCSALLLGALLESEVAGAGRWWQRCWAWTCLGIVGGAAAERLAPMDRWAESYRDIGAVAIGLPPLLAVCRRRVPRPGWFWLLVAPGAGWALASLHDTWQHASAYVTAACAALLALLIWRSESSARGEANDPEVNARSVRSWLWDLPMFLTGLGAPLLIAARVDQERTEGPLILWMALASVGAAARGEDARSRADAESGEAWIRATLAAGMGLVAGGWAFDMGGERLLLLALVPVLALAFGSTAGSLLEALWPALALGLGASAIFSMCRFSPSSGYAPVQIMAAQWGYEMVSVEVEIGALRMLLPAASLCIALSAYGASHALFTSRRRSTLLATVLLAVVELLLASAVLARWQTP